METDIIYTDHCIDDLPVTTVDPMDTFRKNFPIAAFDKATPYADGKILKLTMKYPRNAHAWEQVARCVIDRFQLPLEANVEEWSKQGKTFEVNLVIEFKPKF